MSFPFAPQDSVVPPLDPIDQATFLGNQYDDGSSYWFPTETSPIAYPTSQSYSCPNVAQPGIIDGASGHEESVESFLSWDRLLSTPRAASSPSLAAANLLQPPRRRAQEPWIPLPNGTLDNVGSAHLPKYPTVADYQRSVSDPIHGSHVFSPSGTMEASRRNLASVPRSFSVPDPQGTALPHHQWAADVSGLSNGLSSDQQQSLDNQQSVYAPEFPKYEYHDDLAAYQANTLGNDGVPYDLENQLPVLTPSAIKSPQVSQPSKDIETTNQGAFEDATIPGLDVSQWTPPYGQQNVCLGPETRQEFSLQEGGNHKKRGREDHTPLHVDEHGNIYTEFEDPPPTGLDFDQGFGVEKHHRTEALPWDADDLDPLPRSKRLRLGNGNASYVDNASLANKDGSSAINEQLNHTDHLQGSSFCSKLIVFTDISPDFADGTSASVTMPPVVPNLRRNIRPQKSNRTVKRRVGRSVKQRSQGDLVLQADGTYMFREFGKDDWGE